MSTVLIGIDLAKSVFQLHGVDAQGKVTLRKKLNRSGLVRFLETVAGVPDRHGSLRFGPSLGAGVSGDGISGQAVAAA